MNNLVDKILSKKSIENIRKKYILLGKKKSEAYFFMYTRLVFSVLLFMIIFLITPYPYLYAPAVTLVFYLLSERIVVDNRIKKRSYKLEKEAIFFFEILNLCLESGSTLEESLLITSNNLDNELSLEFRKLSKEISLGNVINESLLKMKERIPSEVIIDVITNIRESINFGTPVKDIIGVQIDYLRDKQMLELKERIAKMPTKISITSVLIFIPILLIIILSPIIIKLLF